MGTDLGLNEEEIQSARKCANCGQDYSIARYFVNSPDYFPKPYDYASGCVTRCLMCWLGCGPEHEDLEGDILRDCGTWLGPGIHLAVMPIARVSLDSPIRFANQTIFYPPGHADLDVLNVIPNRTKTKSLAEYSSAASGVELQTFEDHSIVAFPVEIDWKNFWHTSHQNHLEYIRRMSEIVDDKCLDILRYRLCRIEPVDTLPGRAGQLDSNHMMAGALLYNAAAMQGRIIGGAAFTHFVTRGLGLPIESLESEAFPQEGEVGCLVKHALSLYTAMLEASNSTSKFVQALSLLEYLADPDKFLKFKEVKKTIARYSARNSEEYLHILARFEDLTHKEDPATKDELGYRTRIVHLGDRLESLIPDLAKRRELFEELDSYIRPVIDHMIAHSNLEYAEYLKIREQMTPFRK